MLGQRDVVNVHGRGGLGDSVQCHKIGTPNPISNCADAIRVSSFQRIIFARGREKHVKLKLRTRKGKKL